MRSYPFVLFSACLLACSSGSAGGTTSQEKACLDTADAIARAAQRCGGDYKANYDAFVAAAARGDCANIVAVRDEAALRGTCIPSFTGIACADLMAGRIDASCTNQLEHY